MTRSPDGRFGLNVQRVAHARVPAVHIFLQRIVRHANGMLAVTPVCATLAEVETEIAQLKGELDEIQRQARQAFAVKPAGAAS